LTVNQNADTKYPTGTPLKGPQQGSLDLCLVWHAKPSDNEVAAWHALVRVVPP
jgi:hypothetical protein